MKVLALTNLFPNAQAPNRGIFNLQQFQALGRHCELRVVAPIAWQPWSHGCRRPVPFEERWGDVSAVHPFYFYTPRVGRAAYALWMYTSLLSCVTRVVREYRPDVMLATWGYPDAVAAAALARRLDLPWVAKVHGSDVNTAVAFPALAAQMRWALSQAACIFSVSSLLKRRLVEIGVPAASIRVQHNGIDTERFRLRDRSAVRRELGLPQDRRIVLYVGHLKVAKGVLDLVEAARHLAGVQPGTPAACEPDAGMPTIVLVGDCGGAGVSVRSALEERIRRYGLTGTVELAGPRPHAEIPDWMAAADVLCLPSHNEGCPNVVLESLACGRPVVASHVGAIPELIDPTCGALVPPCAPAELAGALSRALSRDWDATAVRKRVLGLSWEGNARLLAAELASATQRHRRLAAAGAETASGL